MSARQFPVSTHPLALLSRLLSKLDLTSTQRADLERSYSSVTDALIKSKKLQGILRRLELRPQGSIRAGTVVRPANKATFDLDVLCWLEFIYNGRSASDVWQLVWDALGEHTVYKEMREPKPRCIRLSFAKGYDLDITPAVPDSVRPEPMLWVPDKKLKEWSPSNPIGFCDDWLKPIAAKMPIVLHTFSGNVKKGEVLASANERTDRVEQLPEEDGFEKAPLLRLIQLAKFFRDEHYDLHDKNRPSSILLTTITAQSYERSLSHAHYSIEDLVIEVVSAIKSQVQVVKHGESYHFIVQNPADDRGENFAEKWTLETYGAFCRWADGLSRKVTEFIQTKVDGLDRKIALLNSTIPGAARFKLIEDIGTELRHRHDSGNLHLMAVPAMASSLTSIRPTTFFGNP